MSPTEISMDSENRLLPSLDAVLVLNIGVGSPTPPRHTCLIKDQTNNPAVIQTADNLVGDYHGSGSRSIRGFQNISKRVGVNTFQ